MALGISAQINHAEFRNIRMSDTEKDHHGCWDCDARGRAGAIQQGLPITPFISPVIVMHCFSCVNSNQQLYSLDPQLGSLDLQLSSLDLQLDSLDLRVRSGAPQLSSLDLQLSSLLDLQLNSLDPLAWLSRTPA